MKFKLIDLIELWRGEGIYESLEHIETSNWEDDGKYSYCDVIFKYDSKIYLWTITRSGSYFTDYYYDWEDIDSSKRKETYIESTEVERVEVIKYEWRKIKNQ